MTVRYGQSGYSGSSRSLSAKKSERNGRLPLTRAIPAVAKQAGVTRKVARAALEETHDGEWHHTSKYANPVDYYSLKAAHDYLAAQPVLARLPLDWREQINRAITSAGTLLAERIAKRQSAIDELAEISRCGSELICTAYYRTWGKD